MNLLIPGDQVSRPGDFWWEALRHDDGKRVVGGELYLAFPPRDGLKAEYEIYWVACSVRGLHKEGRWWNGSIEKPTVSGSWGVDHYHCWVRDGVMTLNAERAT